MEGTAATPSAPEAHPAIARLDTGQVPFAQQWVTLSKQEDIERRCRLNYLEAQQARSKAKIGWGIYFPTDAIQPKWNWAALFDGKILRQPIIFLGLFISDDDERAKVAQAMSADWLKDPITRDNEHWTALIWMPLHELLESDNIRATFEEWVETRFEEALKAIS